MFAAADIPVDQQRLAGGDDMGGQAGAVGLGGDLLAEAVGELDQLRRAVEQGHIDNIGAEGAAQLLAAELDQAGEVQLAGDRPAHRIDRRQLAVLLLGRLEQAPGFGEQARVLESDAQAGGQGREQAHVGGAEGVLAVDVLQRDLVLR